MHWSLCTGLFNKRDVGRIEREFLDVLDFELAVSEDDVLAHYEPVMLLRRPQPARLRIPTRGASISRPALSRHNSNSTDSSMDEDSPGSTDSGSLPPTPSDDVAQDNTVYVHSLSKHSPENGEADSMRARSRFSAASASVSKESVQKVKDDGHRPRLSSAFNLLRNLHKPSFHHSHSTSA